MWANKLRLAAAALLLSVLLTGCASTAVSDGLADGEPMISRSVTYNTTEAVRTDLMRTASSTVETVYTGSVAVKAGSSGVFNGFSVSRGQAVSEGDVLAVIAGTGSQADIEQLRLELNYANANYAETLAIYSKAVDDAAAAPAETDIDLQIRELRVKKAQAALNLYTLNTGAHLRSLEGSLQAAIDSASETQILAPCDGVVKSLSNIKAGEQIKVGTQLLTVSRSDSICMYSTSGTMGFNYNQSVVVSYNDGGERKTVSGRVVSCDNLIRGAGSYLYIKPDEPVVLGSRANATAECAYVLLRNVVVIPKLGVSTEDGSSYVTVLDGSSTKKRYILKGPQVSDLLAVLQGVREGDLIVTNQYTS